MCGLFLLKIKFDKISVLFKKQISPLVFINAVNIYLCIKMTNKVLFSYSSLLTSKIVLC